MFINWMAASLSISNNAATHTSRDAASFSTNVSHWTVICSPSLALTNDCATRDAQGRDRHGPAGHTVGIQLDHLQNRPRLRESDGCGGPAPGTWHPDVVHWLDLDWPAAQAAALASFTDDRAHSDRCIPAAQHLGAFRRRTRQDIGPGIYHAVLGSGIRMAHAARTHPRGAMGSSGVSHTRTVIRAGALANAHLIVQQDPGRHRGDVLGHRRCLCKKAAQPGESRAAVIYVLADDHRSD